MTIKDIPAQEKYEGYLWMSDSTEPVVLDREPLPEDKISSPNPFVVEAELYDGANLCSFSVHHAGNEIICNRFQLTLDDRTSGHNEERVFKSHHFKDHLELHFIDCWEPQSDELCQPEGEDPMDVLRFTRRIFVGFHPFKINQ
ncbi:TIGR04423 family type III CRISPR-associated protein [Hallella multisaccharivorax]|uniref:TIGR04423 family type III CRISPR-associated protein n=1 Tax=Hallella multisaccharivorax TaxID=310514 RepID=UPI00360CE6CE